MRVMEKSARNAIFKGFFQNSLLGTFESKQTLRQQIKKQTFPKATFQRILRILLGNEVYHTEDRLSNRERGSLDTVAIKRINKYLPEVVTAVDNFLGVYHVNGRLEFFHHRTANQAL